MLKPLVRGALPVILAGACALPLAHADIYTWTDETGRVNLSNLTPPEGVKVTRVVKESAPWVAPPRVEPAPDALREAEVRVLAERVRQLQDEVEVAKRQTMREVESRMIPAPPVIQYIQAPQYVQAPPPPVQYAAAPTPIGGGCGFGFDYADCGFGWWPGFYPASYIVVNSVPNRRGHSGRGDDRVLSQPLPSHGGGRTAPWMPIVLPGAGRGH